MDLIFFSNISFLEPISKILLFFSTLIRSNTLSINIAEKFVGERGRINCSLRDPSGLWRWLGIQFVVSEK